MFTLVRLEGAGDTFIGVLKACYADGSEWHVISIGEMRDGLVWRVYTFFAPAFDPPAWRSSWVEVIEDRDEDVARWSSQSSRLDTLIQHGTCR